MRLGLTLLGYVNKIPYRYRGKYRKVKKPSLHHLFKMKQNFEREEQNMLILRHPYLTTEQSFGHMKALENKKETFLKKVIEQRYNEWHKEITFADRLCHMRVTEGWD